MNRDVRPHFPDKRLTGLKLRDRKGLCRQYCGLDHIGSTSLVTSQTSRRIFTSTGMIALQSSGSIPWVSRAALASLHTNFGEFKLLSQRTNRSFWRPGMGILALQADERVRDVHFSEDSLIVDLMDGRTISVPLTWYPRLLNASAGQRTNWECCGAGYGIHWPELDEDLSTEGLLRGAPAPRSQRAK